VGGLCKKVGAMVFIRYLISGGAAATMHFAVLILLVEIFGINPTVASASGFCAAIAVNYTLQYHWTFRTKGAHGTIFVRYVGVTLVMLVVNTVLFWLLNTRVGLAYLVAQAIATATVVVINFHINQRFTFAPARSRRKSGAR